MSFHSLSAFIDMGGYGLYVWSSYLITLVVFGGNIVRARYLGKEALRQQKTAIEQQAGRSQT